MTSTELSDTLHLEHVKLALLFVEVVLKNRVEEIRKEKGIRQDEFAKMMGVSRQTISSLENGRYNPSIMLAYKIAKSFDMAIEDVFIFDDEEI